MNKGDKVGLASTFEALMSLLKKKIFYKLERTQNHLETAVGGLGKNKLDNQAVGGWAQQIRYFTYDDGSVLVKAGYTQINRANIIINDHVEITEDMILTGCPAGGAAGTYKIQIVRNDDQNVYLDDVGSGVTVPVSTFGNGTCKVQICLYKNVTFAEDLTFYPMLRPATISDDTYEPFYTKIELGPSGEQSDWNESDNTSLAYIKNKPQSMPPSAHSHTVNDISDFPSSMPASDVSAWAKASTKPTYTATEVGALPSSTTYAGSSSAGGAATSANKVYVNGPNVNGSIYASASEPSSVSSGDIYLVYE